MARAVLGGLGWVLMTAGFALSIAAVAGGWDDFPRNGENPMGPNVVVAVAIGSIAFAVGMAMVAIAS